MDAIAQALTLAEETAERYAITELHRIKSELMVQTAQRTRAKGLAC